VPEYRRRALTGSPGRAAFIDVCVAVCAYQRGAIPNQIPFEEVGLHALKGLPGKWEIFGVGR
jgi:hypothetical protein